MLTTFILFLHFVNGQPDVAVVVGPVAAEQCVAASMESNVEVSCVTKTTVMSTLYTNDCMGGEMPELAPPKALYPTADIRMAYECNR